MQEKAIWQKKIEKIEGEISSGIKQIFRRKLMRQVETAPEIPVPEELKRDLERALRYRSQARRKAVECLDYLQECLCGTDEQVMRRFKKASNKAAEQSLRDFLMSGDEKILIESFLNAIEAEVERFFEEQQKYAAAYPRPAQKERELCVSEEIEAQYPFLPRYLKALLSQYPSLLDEQEVERKIVEIKRHLSQARSIFEEIERYAVEIYIALLKTSTEAMEKFLDN